MEPKDFAGLFRFSVSGRTVDFYEHRVIDVLAERSFHGLSSRAPITLNHAIDHKIL